MTDGPADRDAIDVTTTESDDHDRIMRIVMARGRDVLTEDEIAQAFAADLPAEIADLIVDAIDAIEAKVQALEDRNRRTGR